MIYISFQFGKKLCNYSTIAPFVKIVGTTDVEIELNSRELSFFVFKKGCDDMLNIIKDINNLENTSNKFKLGIITSAIETIETAFCMQKI